MEKFPLPFLFCQKQLSVISITHIDIFIIHHFPSIFCLFVSQPPQNIPPFGLNINNLITSLCEKMPKFI